MLGWLSRESLPSGLNLWWVCKALMGKFNAPVRKSTETVLMKVVWSPTNFYSLNIVWRKDPTLLSWILQLHILKTMSAREEKKILVSLIALNLPKARKNSLGHLSSPQLNLQIFTLILKASITQTNAASQWQHCQGRIITSTTDSELLLRFTTSSPSFFCLAEFLALTASSGNKFYQ